MPKKTKRIHKKTNKTRKNGGGTELQDVNSKLDQFQITNVETCFFLIEFLNKNNLKDILFKHYQFINNIENEKLVFGENQAFRKFMNDVIQWFLLDYNQQFSNCLLEIIKNTIENPVFLSKTSSPDEKYNVLLMNIYNMILKYNNKENDVEFFSLLEILLRGLRMPVVKEMVLSNLQDQQSNLIQYKNAIVCLLDNIIKKDLLHNEEIRKLMKELIEDLSYNNVYNWNTFKKLAGLITNCAGSITNAAAKSVFGSFF